MDKQLKKLSRVELLELMISISEDYEKLADENNRLRRMLSEQRLPKSTKVGSIAEAALQANGYFTAAQRSADSYLREIKHLRDELARRVQAQGASPYETDAKARANQIIAKANAQADAIVAEARSRAEEMVASANRQSHEIVARAQRQAQASTASSAGAARATGQHAALRGASVEPSAVTADLLAGRGRHSRVAGGGVL